MTPLRIREVTKAGREGRVGELPRKRLRDVTKLKDQDYYFLKAETWVLGGLSDTMTEAWGQANRTQSCTDLDLGLDPFLAQTSSLHIYPLQGRIF